MLGKTNTTCHVLMCLWVSVRSLTLPQQMCTIAPSRCADASSFATACVLCVRTPVKLRAGETASGCHRLGVISGGPACAAHQSAGDISREGSAKTVEVHSTCHQCDATGASSDHRPGITWLHSLAIVTDADA